LYIDLSCAALIFTSAGLIHDIDPKTFSPHFQQDAYTARMKFIGYFFFIVIMAFQGWANARPLEFHCMMKEVAGHVQMQNCDEATPSCCDQHSASKKSASNCKHTVDCQSGHVGVFGSLCNKPQLLVSAIYSATLHSLLISSDSSNVWRPPQLG
jgi:hypothetical protein